MSVITVQTDNHVAEAAEQIRRAAEAEKCWSCGCLHDTLDAISRGFPNGGVPRELRSRAELARERLVDVEYDCIGCKVCFPALAVNHLNQSPDIAVELDACPAQSVEAREGWPPLPGDYSVIRYHGPVAVCTLTDSDLAVAVTRSASPAIAVAGSMQTENLGIERVVTNVLANPNIRFLVLCGEDSEQAVGHLPGQSLVALAANGLDERSQIVGARGKRPVIKNISPGAIDHFRSNVEVIDLIGEARIDRILGIAGECASQNLGPSEAFGGVAAIKPICGRLPERMTPDPEGYFVIYVDAARRMLSLEHFRKDGVLNAVIEGKAAAELYLPAIEKGMVSRLDHAAYLGKELSRAEKCLEDGENYVQDAAPEMLAPSNRCDCSCPCSEEGS